MKKILIFSFIFLCNASLGHGADWPMFRGDVFNSGRSHENIQAPLSLKWTFEAGDKIISSPSIKDGRVYIGARDHFLYALNEEDGSVVWKFETQHWVDSSPAITEDKVYFSSRDGFFYCLNREDGEKLWSHETAGTDTSSPKVVDGLVYTGAGFPNKYAYALDANDGTFKWKVETSQMIYSSPAVKDNQVYIGSNDGKVYDIGKISGKSNWQYATGGGIYYSSPAIEGNTLYISAGNNDWKVYALNLASKSLKWKFEPKEVPFTPNYVSSVAIGPDDVYVAMGYHVQELYALDKNNGSLKWKVELGPSTRYGFTSSPTITAHTVYMATSKGILKAFDIATGNLTWEYDLGAETLSSISVANGTLYIATTAGKLYAFH